MIYSGADIVKIVDGSYGGVKDLPPGHYWFFPTDPENLHGPFTNSDHAMCDIDAWKKANR